MTVQTLLTLAAGAVILALGLLHLVYTLLDVKRPRRFAPSEDSVRVAMLNSTMRFSRGRTTMWNAWLGFNVSHSLGAIVLGLATATLPFITPPQHATTLLLVLACIAACYLATALRFWFRAPTVGIAIATILIVAALLLQLAGGR